MTCEGFLAWGGAPVRRNIITQRAEGEFGTHTRLSLPSEFRLADWRRRSGFRSSPVASIVACTYCVNCNSYVIMCVQEDHSRAQPLNTVHSRQATVHVQTTKLTRRDLYGTEERAHRPSHVPDVSGTEQSATRVCRLRADSSEDSRCIEERGVGHRMSISRATWAKRKTKRCIYCVRTRRLRPHMRCHFHVFSA